MEKTEADPDHALFSGQIHGLVAACYENERPLAGLAGLLDWRFKGAISRCIRAGAITGKPGECVYLPMDKNGITFHLILVGAGQSDTPGARQALPAETMRALEKNIASLKLKKIGASQTDLAMSASSIEKHFKDVPLRVLK